MTPRETEARRQRPLRVAQVVSSYHPRIGGVETHVQRLAQGCAEAGDDVVVLTHQVGGAPADEMVGATRVLRFPMTVPSRNYSLSLPLFSYLRRHAADFDIVHVHSYHTVIGRSSSRRTITAPGTRRSAPSCTGCTAPRAPGCSGRPTRSSASPMSSATW
jgi:hypothetical protein